MFSTSKDPGSHPCSALSSLDNSFSAHIFPLPPRCVNWAPVKAGLIKINYYFVCLFNIVHCCFRYYYYYFHISIIIIFIILLLLLPLLLHHYYYYYDYCHHHHYYSCYIFLFNTRSQLEKSSCSCCFWRYRSRSMSHVSHVLCFRKVWKVINFRYYICV